MEKIPFFIFFAERSGSTMLTKLLNQHPDISCLPEIFYINWSNKVLRRGKPVFRTEEGIAKQLSKIYDEPSEKACGFKFKFPLQYNHYPSVFEYFKDRSETIKLIFLYRKNRLKGAISRQNHRVLFGINKDSNLPSESKLQLPKLQLDVGNAIKYVNYREEADMKFHNLTNIFEHKYILCYEDLLDDVMNETQNIFKFLEVDDSFEPEILTKKITSDKIRDAISNYDVLQEKLRCHPIEKYLD